MHVDGASRLMRTVSVNSRRGGRRYVVPRAATAATSSGTARRPGWRARTLTAMVSARRAPGVRSAPALGERQLEDLPAPSSAINPVSSASSRNSSGESSPGRELPGDQRLHALDRAGRVSRAWAGSAARTRRRASARRSGRVLEAVPGVTVAGPEKTGSPGPASLGRVSRGRPAAAARPGWVGVPGRRGRHRRSRRLPGSMLPAGEGPEDLGAQAIDERGVVSPAAEARDQHDELVAAEPGAGPRPAGGGASRGPTCPSSASPTPCPKESLISLNRSRSSTRTATRRRRSPAAAAARGPRTPRRRLARPVSSSVRACRRLSARACTSRKVSAVRASAASTAPGASTRPAGRRSRSSGEQQPHRGHRADTGHDQGPPPLAPAAAPGAGPAGGERRSRGRPRPSQRRAVRRPCSCRAPPGRRRRCR